MAFNNADFTPEIGGYKNVGAFRFWVQKVLPLVYDDSLSYMELLGKVINYLNDVISNSEVMQNNVTALYNAFNFLQDWTNTEVESFENKVDSDVSNFKESVTRNVEEFKTYVTTYLDGLDYEAVIIEKLDTMAVDGTLTALITPLVASATPSVVTAWLNSHVTPTSPVVDASLTISGAAADAKVVGDKITERVRLTCDEAHIYLDGVIQTYADVLAIVQDAHKLVTMTYYDMISFMPHAWNGDAIFFMSSFVQRGMDDEYTAYIDRFIINSENVCNLVEFALADKETVSKLSKSVLDIWGENPNFEWEWVEGSYVTVNGEFTDYGGWHRSGYVPLNGYKGKIRFANSGNKHEIYNCFYRADKTLITPFYSDVEIEVPNDAEYFAVSISSKYTTTATKMLTPLNQKLDKKEKDEIATYDNVKNGKHDNLVTSFRGVNATIADNVVTSTSDNGIFMTNKFFSNSANCRLDVVIDATMPIAIYLSYYDSNNTEHFMKLYEKTTSGKIDDTFNFDCASLIVYQDAQEFRIRVNCYDIGTVTLNTFEVYNADGMETSKYFNKYFKPMMTNIMNAVEDLESKQGDVSIVLKDSNGNKYDLQIGANGAIVAIPHIPRKVLFLGNSLVFGMNNTTDRSQSFGMCATDPTKDYRHYVEQGILSKYSGANFNRLYSSPFEHSETLTEARQFITDNTVMFASDLDLVIVQMSENVNTDAKRTTFVNSFPLLIKAIRTNSPNARVVCVGGWFATSIATDTMIETCKKYGCTYISIRDLFTTENLGVTGAEVTYTNGGKGVVLEAWRTHPGNNGMLAIANRIVETLDM